MKGSMFDYGEPGTALEGYLVSPAGTRERSPCVLLAHDWSGPGPSTYALADALSELGYTAFAIDLYGKGRRGRTADESAALMQPFIEDRGLIRRRFQQAVDIASALPHVDATALAAVGHCFGGLCVLDMARAGAPLRGVISVHGVLTPPPSSNAKIGAKVLLLHGNDDPLAPPGDVAAIGHELTAADADWQLHVFGHARHAFTVPTARDAAAGLLYDKRADARSRRLVADFLTEIFAASDASADLR